MGRSLCAAFGVAIAAHASLFALLRFSPALPQARSAEPQDEAAFAVDFLIETLPEAARPETALPNDALATTRSEKTRPETAPPSQKRATQAGTPRAEASKGESDASLALAIGALPKSDERALQPSQSAEPSNRGTGSLLAMRSRRGHALDARRGSLLDEVIAAAPGPEPQSRERRDLIAVPARIGLDSATPSQTKWRHTGDGGMTSIGQPFTAKIAKDGRISFEDRDPIDAELVRWHGIPMPMVVGKFDLTDAAMAAFGEVLYPYRKLRAMDQSRDFRAAMAVRARGESLHSAINRLDKKLLKLWRDRSRSLAERKTLLFALWDECAEEGPSDVKRTASAIREVILRFVSRELPAGSALAYSSHELRTLNADRQSSAEFAPYR